MIYRDEQLERGSTEELRKIFPDSIKCEVRIKRIERARIKLRLDLEKHGVVLPPEHSFSRLLSRIAGRLNIDSDCQIWAVASDDAELAFYDSEANVIVISSGFIKRLGVGLGKMGRNIEEDHVASVLAVSNLVEDYIAAVISHEGQHASRKFSREELESKRQTIVESFKYLVAGHAEEMEADRVGMERMAKAGYNPRAFIDVARAFYELSGVGEGLSHPAMMTRIKHLELLLNDDEHPVINTDKEYIGLPLDFVQWLVKEEEKIYKDTLELLDLSHKKTYERLLKSKSIEDFSVLYKMYIHGEVVEMALEALGEDRRIQELAHKALICNRLFDAYGEVYVDGKLISVPVGRRKYPKELKIKSDEGKLPEPPEVLANSFRKKYEKFSKEPRRLSRLEPDFDERIKEMNDILDSEFHQFEATLQKWMQDIVNLLKQSGIKIRSFQDVFELDRNYVKDKLQTLNTQEFDALQRKWEWDIEDIDDVLGVIEVVKKYYSLSQAYNDVGGLDKELVSFLLRNLYPLRDQEVVDAFIDQYYREDAPENERITKGEFYKEIGGFVDFDDSGIQDLYRRSFQEAVAIRVVGGIFEENKWMPPMEVGKHLGNLIRNRFGLIVKPEIVGNLFLGSNTLEGLGDTLSEEEMLRLLEVNAYVKQLSGIKRMPRTSTKALAYFESLSDHFDPKSRSIVGEERYYRSVLGLSSKVENELIDRVTRKIKRQDRYIEPSEDNIVYFDTVYRLAQLTNKGRIEEICKTLAIYRLLNALREGSDVPLSVVDVISDISSKDLGSFMGSELDVEHIPEQLILKPSDVRLLLEKLPWGLEYTQKYVFRFLNRMFRDRIFDFLGNYGELKEWLDIFKYFLDFVEHNPLSIEGERGKWNRNYYYQIRLLKIFLVRKLKRQESSYSSLVKEFLGEESDLESNSVDKMGENKRFLRLLVKMGMVRNISDILGPYDKVYVAGFDFLLYASGNELLELSNELESLEYRSYYLNYPSADLFSISETLKLLALLSPVNKNEKIFENDLIKSERGMAIWSLSLGEVGVGIIEAILDSYNNEASRWVLENFSPSFQRNKLLAGIALKTGRQEDYENYLSGLTESGWSPDTKYLRGYLTPFARNTAAFDYWKQYEFDGKKFAGKRLIATTTAEYEDIIRRRHPFKGLAFNLYEIKKMEEGSEYENNCQYPTECYEGGYDARGNVEQGLIADKLDKIKEELIDVKKPFDERVGLLKGICPVTSVVRDIHLERMIRVELKREDIGENVKVERGVRLLEMFASNTFTGFYASELIRLKIKTDPEFFSSFDEGVNFVTRLLPQASIKRNYFIDQILELSFVRPEDIEKTEALRITPELEAKGESKSYFYMAILNHLLANINNREERAHLMLWLLGIRNQKPKTVLSKEQHFKGKLDSMQEWFSGLTPYERRLVMSRLLLGEIGVMDIGAAERFEGGKERAERIKRDFLKELMSVLIPDTLRGSQIIRDVVVRVLSDMSSSRAVTVLSEIINGFFDQLIEGGTVNNEMIVADMLASIGVVGKKAAQSLAEQNWWVPEEFRVQLRKSQESASRLSKRALWLLAVQEGLTEENRNLQIVGFGNLLGAASNKQACEVKVKINNEELARRLGLKKGDEMEAVAKFKRPSALKSVVLEEDLEVAERIMHFLQERKIGVLPKGFAERLRDLVKGELKFVQEVDYSASMRRVLQDRGPLGGYRITVPNILYASNNVIIETKAEGISLNTFRKEVTNEKLLKRLHAVLLTEVLYELLISGLVHADLHPGNVFVDVETKTITLIDLGMHISLNEQERRGMFKLLMGLILGRKKAVLSALDEGFGLSLERDMDINIRSIFDVRRGRVVTHQFTRNVQELVKFSSLHLDPSRFNQAAKLDSLFFALSKVTSYVEGLSPKLVVDILMELGKVLTKQKVRRKER